MSVNENKANTNQKVMDSKASKNAIIYGTAIGVTEHLISIIPRNFIDYKQYFHSSKEASKTYLTNVKQQSFNAVFKGLSPYLCGAAVAHIGLFSCLDQSQKNRKNPNSSINDAAWGMLGKSIHDICITPSDTLRMRANVGNVSVVEAYKDLIKTQSRLALFKGLPLTMLMNAPAGAAEFIVINGMQRKYGNDGAKPFMWAFFAGIVSSIIISPLDTIRTCYQCTGLPSPSSSFFAHRNSFAPREKLLTVISKVYEARGMLGFFRGVGLRCISTTITFGLYEFVKTHFDLDLKE